MYSIYFMDMNKIHKFKNWALQILTKVRYVHVYVDSDGGDVCTRPFNHCA